MHFADLRQRLHEGEHVWVVVHRSFDHDGDTQGHEGLSEVQNFLSV